MEAMPWWFGLVVIVFFFVVVLCMAWDKGDIGPPKWS